ncbi:MAG: SPFH domain-containing protein [Ignavibacteriales bacterium]|nr:SPFH domain-containing protein [Ignavibacteriales bacterium]
MEAITEKSANKMNGFMAILVVILFIVGDVLLLRNGIMTEDTTVLWFFIPITILILLSIGGFMVVQPNDSRVLVLFGRYLGTIRVSGFWWVNPFTTKKLVSLRIRNFQSETIKVNDLHGNPIQIAAVVVWRVIDPARALFDVQNYEGFVAIQSETAIRGLATEYAYDSSEHDKFSLVGNQIEISEAMKKQVQTRLEVCGVEILESRISHLSYAPEIAQAMLRRQQAQAVVAARTKIVEGAVGMVDMALKSLSEHNIVDLDNEKKAMMVNNLLVALVSEAQAQPIINAGSLY